MDWEEELEKILDLSSEEIGGKLGISTEAADCVHDAISDYLDFVGVAEPEEEGAEGGG